MIYDLVRDSRLFEFLLRIDGDAAATAAASPCRFCGDRLHRAYFERKPRGLPAGVDRDAAAVRPSFCCRRDGCRRRFSPAMILFLPRRVYVSVVVVLVAALRQGPKPQRLPSLERDLGVAPATVRRWLSWWSEVYPALRGWAAARAGIVPPVDEGRLPASLVERLGVTGGEAAAAITLLQLVREAVVM